jgi:hypothetical protein
MRPYNGYIKDDTNFKKLYENTVMILGHVFETSYLYNKITKEEFAIFKSDNDPTCGLVSKNNDWCLVGGDQLVLRTFFDNTLRLIGDLKSIYDLKIVDDYKVQILIDPWSNGPSIWQLEININRAARLVDLIKICDFNDYIDKPYKEQIEW